MTAAPLPVPVVANSSSRGGWRMRMTTDKSKLLFTRRVCCILVVDASRW